MRHFFLHPLERLSLISCWFCRLGVISSTCCNAVPHSDPAMSFQIQVTVTNDNEAESNISEAELEAELEAERERQEAEKAEEDNSVTVEIGD